MSPRPSKEENYLSIAEAVSERSPCSRRHVGAIIVKNNVVTIKEGVISYEENENLNYFKQR